MSKSDNLIKKLIPGRVCTIDNCFRSIETELGWTLCNQHKSVWDKLYDDNKQTHMTPEKLNHMYIQWIKGLNEN